MEVAFLSKVRLVFRRVHFGPPAARSAFQEMAVMEQTVEHGGDSGAVAKQFSPVFHGAVGGEQRAGALVAAHDDLQQLFCSCGS